MFQGRRAEYKADKFTAQAGLSTGLVSFLEKIKDLKMTGKQTIRNRMYATHPPVMLRIGKMEEYLTNTESQNVFLIAFYVERTFIKTLKFGYAPSCRR